MMTKKKVLSVKKHLERASEGGQGRSRKKQKTKVNFDIKELFSLGNLP